MEWEFFKKTDYVLPAELVTLVASYLLRDCAVLSNLHLLHAQSLQSTESQRNSRIDVRRNILAELVTMDGVQYVKSLRNSLKQATGKERLVLNTQTEGTLKTLYVAEDHLGIRMVIFSRSAGALLDSCVPRGLWWSSVEINADMNFKYETDVSFITID